MWRPPPDTDLVISGFTEKLSGDSSKDKTWFSWLLVSSSPPHLTMTDQLLWSQNRSLPVNQTKYQKFEMKLEIRNKYYLLMKLKRKEKLFTPYSLAFWICYFYKIYLVQFLLVHICLFNINFSQYEDKFAQVAMSNKPGWYKGLFLDLILDCK